MIDPRAKNFAEALWYVGPGQAEVRPEPLPEPKADEVRIDTLHTALSRGTESLVFAGRVPPGEYDRMRGPSMGGAFPFPVKYGYAAVGRVVYGPTDLAERAVFALHPHQTAFVIPADQVVPVPTTVPVGRAVLAANMETALNAVWDARPVPASRIAVVGAGVVGALTAWLCGRLPGADVTLIDVNPSRATVAGALGVHFADPDRAPADCDVVFHASANADGLATALECAGIEATVLEMSWYGEGAVPAPLGGSFHSRRLRFISSQVGMVSPTQRPRWPHRRRLEAALALLADPCLDALIAPPVAFKSLPTQLPRLLAPDSGILCQRIDYETADADASS